MNESTFKLIDIESIKKKCLESLPLDKIHYPEVASSEIRLMSIEELKKIEKEPDRMTKYDHYMYKHNFVFPRESEKNISSEICAYESEIIETNIEFSIHKLIYYIVYNKHKEMYLRAFDIELFAYFETGWVNCDIFIRASFPI